MNKLVSILVLVIACICNINIVEAKRVDSQKHINQNAKIVAKAAKDTGVNPSFMAGLAGVESDFRHKAHATTSSASGLCQFTSRTWRKTVSTYGRKYGLGRNAKRTDARANALMCAEYVKENRRYLIENLKRPVTQGDIYMAHLISPQQTVRLERYRPNAIAAYVMPQFASANKNLFYDKKGKARTVRAFKQVVYGKISNNIAKYGPVVNRHVENMKKITTAKRNQQEHLRLVKNTCPIDQTLVNVVESKSVERHTTVLFPDGAPNRKRIGLHDQCIIDRRKVV